MIATDMNCSVSLVLASICIERNRNVLVWLRPREIIARETNTWKKGKKINHLWFAKQ